MIEKWVQSSGGESIKVQLSAENHFKGFSWFSALQIRWEKRNVSATTLRNY